MLFNFNGGFVSEKKRTDALTSKMVELHLNCQLLTNQLAVIKSSMSQSQTSPDTYVRLMCVCVCVCGCGWVGIWVYKCDYSYFVQVTHINKDWNIETISIGEEGGGASLSYCCPNWQLIAEINWC